MLLTPILDPDQRERLVRLHATLSSASRETGDLIRDGVQGLEFVHGNLSDAASDVAGIFDAEPYSMRDPERVVLTKREVL